MNEGAEEGGGPAGVVEGLDMKLFEFDEWPLAVRDRDSGVDGGLDENGTAKPDIAEGIGLSVLDFDTPGVVIFPLLLRKGTRQT